MTIVNGRDNESFESLLRRFREKVSQDRIFAELKKRRYFLTKGEQGRIDVRKGIQKAHRTRRKARRQE
jgi:ribosomal protein S21